MTASGPIPRLEYDSMERNDIADFLSKLACILQDASLAVFLKQRTSLYLSSARACVENFLSQRLHFSATTLMDVLRDRLSLPQTCMRGVRICMAIVVALGLGLVQEVNGHINNVRAVCFCKLRPQETTHRRRRRLIAGSARAPPTPACRRSKAAASCCVCRFSFARMQFSWPSPCE